MTQIVTSTQQEEEMSLLKTQLHIFPSICALLAEGVVATLQFHNLKRILLLCNLTGRQFSHLAGEGNKAAAVILWIGEDTRLESLACFLVDKISNLHLTMRLGKCQK
jgi:hypothetical protein